jgi:peptidoglycan/xylan/chitin deacetylase (PgdA/CDA1 family)
MIPIRFFKQSLLPFSASLISLKQLIDGTGERVVHVFYHTVSDEYLPHISPLYKFKKVREFERDMDFLLKHFQPVDIHGVLLHATGEKPVAKPSFHLSFDDGLSEVYSIAAPALWRKGIPATLFVNSDFVDNKDLFFRYKAALIIDKLNRTPSVHISKDAVLKIKYPDRAFLDETARLLDMDFNAFLQSQKPYLTADELKTLQQKGFSIGGHSIDHPNYHLLSEKEQIRQALDSCAYAGKTFSEQHQYFAFPFSAEGVSDTFFENIYPAIDLTFGISGLQTSRNGRHIDRIDMENYGKNAKQCIHRAYLTQWMKKKSVILRVLCRQCFCAGQPLWLLFLASLS